MVQRECEGINMNREIRNGASGSDEYHQFTSPSQLSQGIYGTESEVLVRMFLLQLMDFSCLL